jgi:cyanate permease
VRLVIWKKISIQKKKGTRQKEGGSQTKNIWRENVSTKVFIGLFIGLQGI